MARVMLSIPDEFLKEVDQIAKSRHQTRSEYFRELARRDIEQRRRPTEPAEVYRYLREMIERPHQTSWESVVEILRGRDTGSSAQPQEQVHDKPDDEDGAATG